MLIDLHIRNLAVVEEATIELGVGFNVLSGETGAGKSIVVDSLALLSGIRASSEQIRAGADSLSVTGIFQPGGDGWREVLSESGLELDEDLSEDGLVIRREISRSGRNRVFVNDQPVTLKLLTRLAPHLIRIHGQREELGLVDPELQRIWLDRVGGAEASQLLDQAAVAYAAYRQTADRLSRLTGDDRARRERVDFLRFVIQELESAQLKEGEEDELRREREVLRHADAIRQGLFAASTQLFGDDENEGSYRGVSQALHSLRSITSWEPQAGEWVAELEELEIRLGELEPAISRRLDEVELDPRRLDAVEDRLAELERLFRKYGPSSAEVLAEQARLNDELEELDEAEHGREELEAKVEQTLADYRAAAQALSDARRSWARLLEERVVADLRELSLDKARFEVALETRRHSSSPLLVGGEAVEFSDLGFDQVVYKFSPNPGEHLGPLGKVASGGELSRLYLAVQLAGRAETVGSSSITLVFDEVDAGISGAEAAVLGNKLKRLAQGGQVLAVTHLPQVASCADVHFRVKKEVGENRTRTRVLRLEAQGRVEEVARMLAGSEVTDLSLDHAREMIAGAAG